MFKLPKPIKDNLKLIEIILVPLIAMSIPIAIKTKVRIFNIYYCCKIIIIVMIIKCHLIIVQEAYAGFVLIVMCIYWVLECLPLAITALIPIVLFPMFSILSSESVSQIYFKDTQM